MVLNKKCLSHNLLGRVLVPGKNPSRLVMESQRVIAAGVSADKVVVISFKNQVRPRATVEVDSELSRRVQGINWLSPATYVAECSVNIKAAVVHADIVDALLEGAVLGAGAGISIGHVGDWCFPGRVPIACELWRHIVRPAEMQEKLFVVFTLSTSNGSTTGGMGGHGPSSQ